ncbi:MAG: hypothetical protein WKG07_33425 [Hymenobacter sp.]
MAAGRALLAKGQTSRRPKPSSTPLRKPPRTRMPGCLTMIAQAYAESDVKDIGKAQ